jgi:hypothetical protein
VWLGSLVVGIAAFDAHSEGERRAPRGPLATPGAQPVAVKPAADCSEVPHVVEIREADPRTDPSHHDQMRNLFVTEALKANTTILLGPKVLLDFSNAPDWQRTVEIGRCVTIKSVAQWPSPDTGGAPEAVSLGARARVIPRGTLGDAPVRPHDRAPDPAPPPPIPEARGPFSLGPELRFGPHRTENRAFLQLTCAVGDASPHDHVHISGFRLIGPSMGQQEDSDVGIKIQGCVDVSVSNMEIAGWGGQGVRVDDGKDEEPLPPPPRADPRTHRVPPIPPPVCHEPPFNGPTGRIGSPDQVRIFNNYIHHNQHPRTLFNGHTAGYGVAVYDGAWAQIYENLFAHNRHAIAGSGAMGGYEALRNLVLRYGGIHYDGAATIHTHIFDMHGTGDNGFDGVAGSRTKFAYNAFQYADGAAISIRGLPRCGADISNNIFPHHGLENDWGADAVKLQNRDAELKVVRLGPDNQLDFNSYGQYGVCDFDGDGIDDLFLATGKSWWYSSGGEFPWRYLAQRPERLSQVRFGYFDANNRCDVLTESGGRWLISSGGAGQPYPFTSVHAPLDQVQFGRFDPSDRDSRPNITKRTTHAFWRTASGQWRVARLTGPEQAWHDAQSSRLPLDELRFADVNGDGVTDVLSVQGGRWAYSDGGASTWKQLNAYLGDDLVDVYFADLDGNGIDDIIRLTHSTAGRGPTRHTYTWQVSTDGRGKWKPLKSYSQVTSSPGSGPKLIALAGRFGQVPGGAVLFVDQEGVGNFYGPPEGAAGASPDWKSLFDY